MLGSDLGKTPTAARQQWRNQRDDRLGQSRHRHGLATTGLGRGRSLRLGISDAPAVLHILYMPDPEQRKRHVIALAEELAQFERPQPKIDEYDLLLAAPPRNKEIIQ